jgi:hypothetical protein
MDIGQVFRDELIYEMIPALPSRRSMDAMGHGPCHFGVDKGHSFNWKPCILYCTATYLKGNIDICERNGKFNY